MKKWLLLTALSLSLLLPIVTKAEFMDEAWAQSACEAWNNNETLTTMLGKPKNGETRYWIGNDGNRGYKLIQLYRTHCGEDSKIQLTLVEKEGQAICEYGGKPDGKRLNFDIDYLLHANDQDWTCIGNGDWGCGAMGAMMSKKLHFRGSKLEIMSVMPAFESFLKLTAEIEAEKTSCEAL